MKSLTNAVRLGAYAGAKARTVAAEVADTEKTLRGILERFRFERVELAADHNAGAAHVAVTVNGVTTIDHYPPERVQGGLAWKSAVLPRGEHTFVLTVLGEANPASRYVWVNADRVEIDA